MAVKITLEYANVEEAIAALGKLAGIAPAVVATPVKERKGRSDAGKPRGSHKDANVAVEAGTTKAVGSGAAGAQAGVTDSSKAPEQGANSTSTVPPAAPASPQKTAAPVPAAAQVQEAPRQEQQAPAAAAPTPEDVQAAVEALFNAKGFDDCAMVLSRFGVKRGKDLLPEHRAEFIAKAKAVAAGTERP